MLVGNHGVKFTYFNKLMKSKAIFRHPRDRVEDCWC